MKKVLITGAGGFIGSHLVEECVHNNLEVVAFVHYNSRNSWGWLEESGIKNEIEIIQGDIRDFDTINKAIKGCDTVFHLAALIGIPYSYVSPIAYIRTNIEGTYNILEAARIHDVSNINVTSTSETFGSAQYIPIDEKHPMVGQSPYSATKIAADQLAISYFRSFGLPVKIVRPFNTYGPRQSARAIVPTIITQILDGKKQLYLGNLEPRRDMNYVQDTVKGFLAIANQPKFNGEIINIGSGYEISVRDLVKTILNLIGDKVEIVKDIARVRPDNSEVERLCCDNSKLMSLTDWKPEVDLKKGLKLTIEWIENNLNKYKSDIYNV
jgi:NAD dependent epimerase/dehydratase